MSMLGYFVKSSLHFFCICLHERETVLSFISCLHEREAVLSFIRDLDKKPLLITEPILLLMNRPSLN